MDVLERPQSDVPVSLAVVFKAPVRASHDFFIANIYKKVPQKWISQQ